MAWQTLKKTTSDWQQALSDCISDPQDLIKQLKLQQSLSLADQATLQKFPLRVPRQWAEKMRLGDVSDPLLRQVLPIAEEMQDIEGFTGDPVGDLSANRLPGLLHKYHGRVLLTVAGGCAIHCRYCFRREFPYQANNPGRKGWQSVLDYIAQDDSIEEVIYSGGDPLIATDNVLAELTQAIANIPHVKRLRIHTRLPIVIPQRITDGLLSWLSESRLQPVMVLHTNHANELCAEVDAAMQRLRNAGVQLLNQAVLLRGVNDSVAAQAALSQRLFQAGVLPYYLHMLDWVQGAAHFLVSDSKAKQLMKQVADKLPGYLVPKLVREVAHMGAKQRV